MERLLKDAQAVTGVEYNIDNLADVYTAIGVIQEKLGIAGTTAREAESTISGSAAMMKAAWQNTLTAISGGGDLDKAINNLVYSVQKYFENIVPVIERSLQGVGRMIEKIAPLLVQTIARALIQAIPSLLNAVYQMITGLVKGIYQGIVDLFKGGAQKVVEAQTNEIAQSVENQNALTEAVEETEKAQKGALAGFDEINTLSSNAAESAEDLAMNTVSPSNVGGITVEADTKKAETQLLPFFKKILQAIKPVTDALGRLFDPIKKSFDKVDWQGMKNGFTEWLKNYSRASIDALAQAIDTLRIVFEALEEPLTRLWNNALQPIVNALGGWLTDIAEQLGEAFGYLGEKVKEYEDEIAIVVDGISGLIQLVWSFVQPLIDAIVNSLLPVLKLLIDGIFYIIDAVSELFLGFKNTFAGINALIKGDTDEAIKYFKKALANLVNVFVGIANAIISVINSLWELIFDAFKGIVNGVGGLIEKIGGWLGYDWELDWKAKAPLIPKIPKYVPKLATGTVVPPNREFMTVLGDNKREPEIVSPLSTMKQAVAEVLAQANVSGGYGRIEVPVIIDGREIARAVRDAENSMGKQTVFGGFANAY